jgi:hypothetical protein
MAELQVDEEGRYLGGEIPFGYALWGDRLIELPAELDAGVSAIRLVKQGKQYEEITAALRRDHGVELTRAKFDALIKSVYRRYGPI